MNYVIKNSKNIFIRIDKNGKAVPCSEAQKTLFEYSKAKNLCNNLPKNIKKSGFKVECVPEISSDNNSENKKVITNNYKPCEQITRWFEKFNVCDELIEEAKRRKTELNNELSKCDKALNNELHLIELEKWKDGCSGYKEYKTLKTILEKRRMIKDEFIVVNYILNANFINYDKNKLDKVIEGLSNRKFTLRIVEGDDENIGM